MRLVGGSLGFGFAKFDKDGVLHVNNTAIKGNDVKDSQVLERRKTCFSIARFLGMFVIFVVIFFVLSNILPVGPVAAYIFGVIGLVVPVALGFYERDIYIAELTLTGGEKLILAGTYNEINALVLPAKQNQ